MKFSAIPMVLVSMLLMTACQVTDREMLTSHAPTPHETSLIVEKARNSLYDPYSIRDAEIVGLVNRANGSVTGCLIFNSKNALGGYTGRSVTSLTILKNDTVYLADTESKPEDASFFCKGAGTARKIYPFPALEQIGGAAKE